MSEVRSLFIASWKAEGRQRAEQFGGRGVRGRVERRATDSSE